MVPTLVDQDFLGFIQSAIKSDQIIASRKKLSKVYGSCIVSPLIKNKKYRNDITEFVDSLRTSNNFRDRQMYIVIGKAAFKADAEIFKKHFAKSIGIDLLVEKVKVVQISLAKLLKKVPRGSIRSCDKVRDHLLENTVPDVHQFLLEHNHLRFLDESKLT